MLMTRSLANIFKSDLYYAECGLGALYLPTKRVPVPLKDEYLKFQKMRQINRKISN
jgi:hypothetical protein